MILCSWRLWKDKVLRVLLGCFLKLHNINQPGPLTIKRYERVPKTAADVTSCDYKHCQRGWWKYYLLENYVDTVFKEANNMAYRITWLVSMCHFSCNDLHHMVSSQIPCICAHTWPAKAILILKNACGELTLVLNFDHQNFLTVTQKLKWDERMKGWTNKWKTNLTVWCHRPWLSLAQRQFVICRWVNHILCALLYADYYTVETEN